MRQSTANLIVTAISVASLAAIVVIALDISSGDGSPASIRSSASYLGSPVSSIVFAILFLGGGAFAAWARSTAAALAVLPTLGLAFAPVIIGFREGLLVPHGAIIAVSREFEVDGKMIPCPPGWTVVTELAGKMPLGAGAGSLNDGTVLSVRILGDDGGEENHTLTVPEMPQHNHTPAGNFNSMVGADGTYTTGKADNSPGELNLRYSTLMVDAGGGMAHNNMPPFLVVQFCSLD